ncbi:Crp/Fnr family transcriptional regulator [Cupriavidus basilensis]|uniref:Crp/Fnr family transcriptional regulator n=1 Tax=Cupriavidus basilensis TaxID=68895 RepID=UPI0020A660A8|nr:Crp/Fnr family transcriptional regulator [Cupriavidus basilensis]MCP3020157.1 Crp/Fnr family transcriptional regulator [Cupriavidus basilensis]MDR3380315.1 Crp/Fnr family transcriptional regulator [Cupriavidus basilensis]
MTDTELDLSGNHLLGALPPHERRLLLPRLDSVNLRTGQLLSDSGQRIRHLYFPSTAVISMMSLQESGATVELASVGREGLVGLPALTGAETMPNRIEVRRSGAGFRVAASELRAIYPELPTLQRMALLYMQALLTQVSQTAVCIRHHSLTTQLCRWLLLALDRSPCNELDVTQQTIADMLGVRREGVTEAVGKLAELQMIRHSRGHITVIDRAGLEGFSGESYRIVRSEFDRLLSRAAG